MPPQPRTRSQRAQTRAQSTRHTTPSQQQQQETTRTFPPPATSPHSSDKYHGGDDDDVPNDVLEQVVVGEGDGPATRVAGEDDAPATRGATGRKAGTAAAASSSSSSSSYSSSSSSSTTTRGGGMSDWEGIDLDAIDAELGDSVCLEPFFITKEMEIKAGPVRDVMKTMGRNMGINKGRVSAIRRV